ncbi:MAG: sulfate transporter [Candidatus Zixiibacteriota bacterium]|nr:MAG: sulfate transporter [candidate division Zixibacteria bacterium]
MAANPDIVTGPATAVTVPAEQSLPATLKANIQGMRFDLRELSGGLGDLGTFIPIVTALSIVSGMDIAMILVVAGLANIATGLLFGLPIPVQPMKSIAAVAIVEKLLPPEIAAAGLLAGAVMFLLGTSNLITRIDKVIPKPVVRGIQLGVGIKLALKGVSFISALPVWGLNSMAIAGGLLLLLLVERRVRRFPTALVFLLTGFVIMYVARRFPVGVVTIGLPHWQFILPAPAAWWHGLLYGAIPQLPLTILNSVVAVCALSGDLFPGRRVPVTKMSVSVGLMNLLGCWFGGMPMCHGSGGLAGQYRFGARTGGSVVALGTAKLLLGLFFGTTAAALLVAYPRSVLGVMLVLAGIELARPARDQRTLRPFVIMALTAAGIIAVNVLVGFLVGMAVAVLSGIKKNR